MDESETSDASLGFQMGFLEDISESQSGVAHRFCSQIRRYSNIFFCNIDGLNALKTFLS